MLETESKGFGNVGLTIVMKDFSSPVQLIGRDNIVWLLIVIEQHILEFGNNIK